MGLQKAKRVLAALLRIGWTVKRQGAPAGRQPELCFCIS
jgi:hypothetical protein